MQDRVSLYPGRVTLTPVSGQANTYDMERADSPTQAGTPLSKASLLKDATAAMYGLPNTAVPDEVLGILGDGVLVQASEKYTKVTKKLSEYAVGDTVQFSVDGALKDFVVVHQGKPSGIYDDSCNGTWLLMKDCYESRQWHSSNVNDYQNSSIHSYLNSNFLDLFEVDIKAQIRTVKLPYVNGTGGSAVASGANGLSAKIFLLGGYEVGWTTSDGNFPVDGAKLSYFDAGTGTTANNKRIANLSDSATAWWLRSPHTTGTVNVWLVNTVGGYSSYDYDASYSHSIRPALIMEPDTTITWYTDSSGNIYTEQEIEMQLTDVLGNLIQVPASQIKDNVRIEIGSYVGTGTYGESNKNSLTFDFEPKIVIVAPKEAQNYKAISIGYTVFINEMENSYGPLNLTYSSGSAMGYGPLRTLWQGNSVLWGCLNGEAIMQLNVSGKEYLYVAIG